ncbi:MAG: pyridoxamine 5'-phosphate oxidase family protein [Syntrophobacteraceae bacterium]|nr:pyridoxamine 5'-phosphate oxidase family protein [Syntrophobacteraceae bacterium]
MDYETLALKLIEEQHTMTLATSGAKGPWAAPVYYVFLESAFYFFSNPSSRHIEESLKSRRTSAAIFSPVTGWQDIRGLQMSGAVETVSPGAAALRAMRSYLQKFPFTRDFFNPSDLIDFKAFSVRFRVSLYRFEPDLAYYLDNSIKFGFRERVHFKKG